MLRSLAQIREGGCVGSPGHRLWRPRASTYCVPGSAVGEEEAMGQHQGEGAEAG